MGTALNLSSDRPRARDECTCRDLCHRGDVSPHRRRVGRRALDAALARPRARRITPHRAVETKRAALNPVGGQSLDAIQPVNRRRRTSRSAKAHRPIVYEGAGANAGLVHQHPSGVGDPGDGRWNQVLARQIRVDQTVCVVTPAPDRTVTSHGTALRVNRREVDRIVEPWNRDRRLFCSDVRMNVAEDAEGGGSDAANVSVATEDAGWSGGFNVLHDRVRAARRRAKGRSGNRRTDLFHVGRSLCRSVPGGRLNARRRGRAADHARPQHAVQRDSHDRAILAGLIGTLIGWIRLATTAIPTRSARRTPTTVVKWHPEALPSLTSCVK